MKPAGRGRGAHRAAQGEKQPRAARPKHGKNAEALPLTQGVEGPTRRRLTRPDSLSQNGNGSQGVLTHTSRVLRHSCGNLVDAF